MAAFLAAAAAYRFDEVLGSYRSYRDVLAGATERAARRFGASYRPGDGRRLEEAFTAWEPFPEVPATLRALAERLPLVILSNADTDQIQETVTRLEAPFHAVISAEEAGAYKPRLAAFEYMQAQLGCVPEEILHVSASPQYDLRPARDVGITKTVFVNRSGEPPQPWLGYREIEDLSSLVELLTD
jgi:2-haloacid dehalogenase